MKQELFVVIIVSFILLTGCDSSKKTEDNYKQSFISNLQEKGYEVTNFNYIDNNAILKMKTFGVRREQVTNSFVNMGVWYPNASKYMIQISSSAMYCNYEVSGIELKDTLSKLNNAITDDDKVNSIRQLNTVLNSEICN